MIEGNAPNEAPLPDLNRPDLSSGEPGSRYAAWTAPRIGFGRRPLVLAVDLARGFTDPASPLAADLDAVVEATVRLLRAARRAAVPVALTTVAYDSDPLASMLVRKAPHVALLEEGSRWTELDPRLEVEAGDLVLAKQGASAFFGTALAGHLHAGRIDTVLIAGCMTSGCVRASAVDAAQHGFHTAVVREAVGDRSAPAHEANLLDVDQRYGDVVSLVEAEGYLASPRVSGEHPAPGTTEP